MVGALFGLEGLVQRPNRVGSVGREIVDRTPFGIHIKIGGKDQGNSNDPRNRIRQSAARYEAWRAASLL
jgi:hypothetical protein